MTDEEAQLDFDVDDIPEVPVKRGRGRPRRTGPTAPTPKRRRKEVVSKAPQGPGSKAPLQVPRKRGRPRKTVIMDDSVEEGEVQENETGKVAAEPPAGVSSETSDDPAIASPTASAHTASPARTDEIEAAGITSPDENSPVKPTSDPPSERLFDETDRSATSSHSESHKSPDAGTEYNDALDRLYLSNPSMSPSPDREPRSPEETSTREPRSPEAEVQSGDAVAADGSLAIEKHTMTRAGSYRIRKRFGMTRPDEIVIDDESDSNSVIVHKPSAEKTTSTGFGSWDVAPEPEVETTNAWRVDTPEVQPDPNSGWGQSNGSNGDDHDSRRQSWGSKGRKNDGNNDNTDSNWNNNNSQGGYSNSRGGYSGNGYRGDSGYRRGGFRGGRGGRGRGGFRNNYKNNDNRNNNEYDGGNYSNSGYGGGSYGNSGNNNSGHNNTSESSWGNRYDRPNSPQRGPSDTPPPLVKPLAVVPAAAAPRVAEPIQTPVVLPSSGGTQYAGADGVRYVLLQPEASAYGAQQYLPMTPQHYAPQPFAPPMHPQMPMMMPYGQPMMPMYGMPHMQYPDMYMMRGPAMPAPMPALMQSPHAAILQSPSAVGAPAFSPSTPTVARAPVAPTLTPTHTAAAAATPSMHSANANEAGESLPAGWVIAQSKSYSGMRYYRNTVTGEKSWEVPTTPAVATGASAYDGSRSHENGYGNKYRTNDSDRSDFRRQSYNTNENYTGGDRFNSRNRNEGPSGHDGSNQRRRVSNNYNENSQGGKRNFTQPEQIDNSDVPSGW